MKKSNLRTVFGTRLRLLFATGSGLRCRGEKRDPVRDLLTSSAFELSRWRGGRYRVYSLKRRWSLEEFTVQRYDDVDMSGETSSTSMNINNCLIAQLLFLQ
jgi:hypothetical protein